MGALDYLAGGVAPGYATTTGVSASSTPDWYTEYMKGIAGKGVELAANQEAAPVAQQSIAGFTPDQTQAFQGIRDNQGIWKPGVAAANGALTQAQATATGAATAANGAVAGPAKSWTDPGAAAKYMSPYTSSVVNEIARLGTQNFDENVMPKINASMIGSGQFGSERNADVLGRAGRDVQQNISGQQASALESGYATAGNLFNQDANRDQQQQQTQASTALAGGQLGATTALGAAQQGGALAATTAGLGLQDAQALQASGQQQQQLNQTGLDTDYNNTIAGQQQGWSTLNNLNTIVRGAQLPTTQTAINNGPLTRSYSASPLASLGAGFASAAGT